MNEKIDNTLIIAAAGSGKTTELIRLIKHKTEELPDNKILAVITYTNAATNEIVDRLGGNTTIQSNVFIGTIHSFLIRFLIKPYGKILGLISDELIISDYKIELEESKDSFVAKAIIEAQLSKKGIVTYDYIETLAKKILKDENVKERFCSRIQYLFVDEFQDSSKGQFEIIEKLRKEKRTQIILVGDPEQRIMGFKNRIITHPIDELQKPNGRKYILKRLENNHRSSETIVRFINNFHSSIEQNWANTDIESKNEIIFITSTEVKNILSEFNIICEDENYAQIRPKTRFFLAFENNLYGEFRSTSFNHKTKENEPLISSILDFLSAFFNVRKSSFSETLSLDEIELRKKCLLLFNTINQNQQTNLEEILLSIEEIFNYKRAINEAKVQFDFKEKARVFVESLTVRKSANNIGDCSSESKMYQDSFLTIHKSKGLQADAVLVVAKTEKDLLKWLEEDKDKRLNSNQDTCRLGYVAFSRPRELLCIACLEPVGRETEQLLQNLKVNLYPVLEKIETQQLELELVFS
ncbi:UvrD-helicase domain-containing protein [Kurthia huakuii]|uniref:UvrD-helicase domain-containing protein n=1 Tax=Kurthia huakuii TaxID=1421019 RepID=UPI0004982B8F|nr:UvrD-helicase domain-containing protein [Kurthia huakuii]MBM7699653.1 DNA helicase-2/ATP-dependent DNA helicase PcrA [Kurthia huakuii]